MYQNQFFKKIENWQVSEHRCTRADNQEVRESFILKTAKDWYLASCPIQAMRSGGGSGAGRKNAKFTLVWIVGLYTTHSSQKNVPTIRMIICVCVTFNVFGAPP